MVTDKPNMTQKLTDEELNELRRQGHNEDDINYIDKVIMLYMDFEDSDTEQKLSIRQARERLPLEEFISGVGRASWHRSAQRGSVSFDTNRYYRLLDQDKVPISKLLNSKKVSEVEQKPKEGKSFSLEKLATDDYENYVKSILAIEYGTNPIQLQKLYEIYMADDDFSLVNPAFTDLLQEIDWEVVYMTKHLDNLLQFNYETRNAIVAQVQAYFQAQTSQSEWLSDGNIEPPVEQQVTSILFGKSEIEQTVNLVYRQLLTQGILADRQATFSDVVNVAARADLLEEKEQFLRHYLDVMEQEQKDYEKSEASPTLEIQ